MYRHLVAAVGAIVIATLPLNIQAQGRPDSAAQSEAMKRLAFMDGTWRGTTQSVLPTGEKHTITQTERVGPFLGGTVKVIEGLRDCLLQSGDARVQHESGSLR